MRFSDRLSAAIDRCGTVACVGLDPVLGKIPAAVRARHHDPAEAVADFCRAVVDALAPAGRPLVPVVKPQSACFERYGSAGVAALRSLVRHARSRGLLVLLDAKRGDIGATAEHYAAATVAPADPDAPASGHHADAVTLSGYMGPDTLEPFLPASMTPAPAQGGPGHGVFVLVRTSNPGSDAVQAQRLADGRSVAELLADQVHLLGRDRRGECGLSDVGAVVGATKSAEAAALRARMPHTVFLIPGYGAQGGTVDDIRPCLRPVARTGSPASLGVLVNASRSVLYPPSLDALGDAWPDAVADAARTLVRELGSLNP